MLERVRSKKPLIGSIMDLLNPFVMRIIGVNINRDTVENIRKAGLRVVEETDLMMDIVNILNVKRISGVNNLFYFC